MAGVRDDFKTRLKESVQEGIHRGEFKSYFLFNSAKARAEQYLKQLDDYKESLNERVLQDFLRMEDCAPLCRRLGKLVCEMQGLKTEVDKAILQESIYPLVMTAKRENEIMKTAVLAKLENERKEKRSFRIQQLLAPESVAYDSITALHNVIKAQDPVYYNQLSEFKTVKPFLRRLVTDLSNKKITGANEVIKEVVLDFERRLVYKVKNRVGSEWLTSDAGREKLSTLESIVTSVEFSLEHNLWKDGFSLEELFQELLDLTSAKDVFFAKKLRR